MLMEKSIRSSSISGLRNLIFLLLFLVTVNQAFGQGKLIIDLQSGISNWGSDLYEMDNLGRCNGFYLDPQITLKLGKLITSGRLNYGYYSFRTESLIHEFKNSNNDRMKWLLNNVTLNPRQFAAEFQIGVSAGRAASVFLTWKLIDVTIKQHIHVSEYKWDYPTATWNQTEEKSGYYNTANSKTWTGFGCKFNVPVYFRRFRLKGDIRYYIWGDSGTNVLQARALFGIPLNKDVSFYTGASLVLVTNSILLDSMFIASCGLEYRIKLAKKR